MVRLQNKIALDTASVSERSAEGPVFILGTMPRSGTNFLHRLICLHPDCGAVNTTPVREDYLLHHTNHLRQYVQRLRWQWGHWGADDQFMEPLARSLGEGLSGFLHTLTEAKRVVTKTPSVRYLSCFHDFFPDARLLIIVRDGRSVVASGMAGFGWRFERATRQWASAAQQVLNLQSTSPSANHRFMVVRYESLCAQTTDELKRIFTFLDLEEAGYDFDAAQRLPVFGSSFLKSNEQNVVWEAREKEANAPVKDRWDGWSKRMHMRFNHLAGQELEAFGYERHYALDHEPTLGMHRVRDAIYALRHNAFRVRGSMKAAVRAFKEELQEQPASTFNLKRKD